jgi:hypothetical protein
VSGLEARDLSELAGAWFDGHPQNDAGKALVCYRAGTAAPLGAVTRAFASVPAPHSLDVLLYDPNAPQPAFLMVLALTGDYIGAGEYKGGADDVLVGLGVADATSTCSTWTAAESTASDFVAYGAGDRTTAGTLTSTGLVAGPVFGPAAGTEPACSVLFAWFELSG